ncbi:MAG: peptide chain release factor N(5)-glutamine methyltransferase [Candidatus Eisenbacteria sp.]|nr:peptide chain release factor N(5)-glutamine methyltransferase [Candidatus Eisenbacteria bacterium]
MIYHLIAEAARSIKTIGAGNPRFEAELLLAEALGRPRVFLFTHPDARPNAAQRARFDELLGRRLSGEPLQYVLGTADFRHLTLRVGPGVLIPRSETERLVDFVWASLGEWRRRQGAIGGRELAVRSPRLRTRDDGATKGDASVAEGDASVTEWDSSITEGDTSATEGMPWIVDVGIGSGAILLALMDEARREEAVRPASEGGGGSDPDADEGRGACWFRPLGIDVSPVALHCTLENAALNNLPRPHLVRSHLLSCLSASDPPMPVAAIVSNPPYIATGEMPDLSPEIREHEPPGALDGGADGLAVIRELLDAALAFFMRGTLLAFEIGATQADDVRRELQHRGLLGQATIHPDLAGRPRVVLVEPWREGGTGT